MREESRSRERSDNVTDKGTVIFSQCMECSEVISVQLCKWKGVHCKHHA